MNYLEKDCLLDCLKYLHLPFIVQQRRTGKGEDIYFIGCCSMKEIKKNGIVEINNLKLKRSRGGEGKTSVWYVVGWKMPYMLL